MAEYLVTGGTSFIASHVVKALLDLGHSVRTTVRDSSDEEKVRFLWELKGAKERLKIYEADLTVEGSFDKAVYGVDGVFHIASRVSVCLDDNNLGALVLGLVFSQIHCLVDECLKMYVEAWIIAAEKKLNLVVLIPAFSIGPRPTSSPLILLSIVKGVRGEYPNFRGGFVHIDDVVAAQILAMEEPKASGRIICSSSSVAHWSEIIEMLTTKYPLYPYETKCGSEEGRDMPHSLDTTKIRELGFASFKPLDEMFDDCIKCFQDKGLL